MSDSTNDGQEDQHSNLRAQLAETIGADLANKLLKDLDDASTDFFTQVKNLILRSFEMRSSLMKDDLCESRYASTRDNALHLLHKRQGFLLHCSLLECASMLAVYIGEPMSNYVGHAAKHYETEATMKLQATVRNALLATITRSANPTGAPSN